ncbi:MAG: serine protease, partial [Deltaproteobacteria bacterium]|nr:serine protease [Deltaproteobacteria bacterium]
MNRSARVVVLMLMIAAAPANAGDRELDRLKAEFTARTGAALVFDRADLPAGDWYDGMPALDLPRQRAAAKILVAESAMYPRGWLGSIGLRTVGVFDALVSKHDDGYHTYDRARGGYLYYGMWNGANAVAAAYYTDGQLPLTFHHEAFHHVDGTVAAVTDHARFFTDDDDRLAAALDGSQPYAALALSRADARALATRASETLARSVGDYSGKSAGEDQAETARWLMSHLADGLTQVAAHPELAGSQRILHVLAAYRAAGRDGDGPDAAWLTDVALGRDPAARRFARLTDDALGSLIGRVAPAACNGGAQQCSAAAATDFVVWGQEDASGGNATLRADIARFATVGAQLIARGKALGVDARTLAKAGTRVARLLADYRAFIASRWSISAGTEAAFARAQAVLGVPVAPAVTNPYLANVDRVIDDPAWRARIRAVQPATVKLGGGSGVNLAASGLVLTAGHVVDRVGATLTVRFPDGSSYAGTAIAFDDVLDLGLVRLDRAHDLPVASLAAAAPSVGDDVCVIGQPGTRTPDGDATGYQPWTVTIGHIRGFRAGDRVGEQHLGRAKHDAWTYWGHSGSPLFDRDGKI